MAYGKIASSSGRKLVLSPDGWMNNEGENLNAAPGGNWLNTLTSAGNPTQSEIVAGNERILGQNMNALNPQFLSFINQQEQDFSKISAERKAADGKSNAMMAQLQGQVAEMQPKKATAPAGYRFTQAGNLEAIPGGPADLKNSEKSVQQQNDANSVLSLTGQAESILPKAHGSGIGTAVGGVANFFGIDNDKNKADAQLKVVAGGLVSKMPKMSGPQSDKDVQLYREMAGQVGDSTLPIEVRQAALKQVRAINTKYATPQAQSVQQTGGMQTGQVVDGYKFLGGNPADKTRWLKVQ